jgi:hypothetical protein
MQSSFRKAIQRELMKKIENKSDFIKRDMKRIIHES